MNGRNLISDARSCLHIPLPDEGGDPTLAVLYTATARRFLEEAQCEIDELRKGIEAREAALVAMAKAKGSDASG